MTVSPELPDVSTLMEMRRQGKLLKEIADSLGVTPAAVWKQLTQGAQAGQGDTADGGILRTVEEMTGWAIEARHRNSGVMRRLETFNRSQQHVEVEPASRRELMDWVLEMNSVGAVLDYDPDAPPNDASRTGGFFYRRRVGLDDRFFRVHRSCT